jgi:outer membrane lipopolysaccharide assembly protein LptE/RlpB
MRRAHLTFCLVLATGCGYRTVGSAAHLPPNVRTLAIPVFATRAQAFHTEMAFTGAVVREFDTRTRLRVVQSEAGMANADATLTGTILSQTSSPLTYDSSSGQTSSYLITITAKVVLKARDGRVLYQNDALPFREQYQSTQDVSGFIQEDGPAVQRMARDFAHGLVSDIMESF